MTAVIPITRPPLCSRCHEVATRYLSGGSRRRFYCTRCGPTKLSDYDRLLPLDAPTSPLSPDRVLGKVPPLPEPLAVLVERFVAQLREVVAGLTALGGVAELEKLRAELAKVTAERDAAESVASEAMELWGSPSTVEVSGPPTGPALVVTPGTMHLLDERSFPLPPEGPTPGAPSDAETFGPADRPTPRPTPAKRGKGYTVEAPSRPVAASAPAPGSKAEQPENGPPGAAGGPVAPDDAATPQRPGLAWVTAETVDLFSLTYLVSRIPLTKHSPALASTRRALRDFEALPSRDKIAVLSMLERLANNPASVIVARIGGSGQYRGDHSLKVTGGLRVVVRKHRDDSGRAGWRMERIARRGDPEVFSNER